MFAQLLRLSRIAARARPATDLRWQRTVDEVAARYGIRHRVTVLQTESADLLATSGWLRPRILVPGAAAGWSDERIRVVACHELAHVRRHDWAVQMAADVARRLYWFQPLMWIASGQLRRESEHACDDLVLAAGVAPQAYAGHLLQIARAGRSDYRWVPAVPMARRSSLERRIAAMLNSARNRRALSSRSLVLSGVVLAVAMLSAAAVHTEQTRSGQLVGTIYDGSGAVMPGVEVSLSTGQDAKSKATSDAAGRFSFPNAAPGRYVLEAALPGFIGVRQEFELKEAGDWDRVMTLQVGQLTGDASRSAPSGSRPRSPVPGCLDRRRSGSAAISRPRRSWSTSTPSIRRACAQAGRAGVVQHRGDHRHRRIRPLHPGGQRQRASRLRHGRDRRGAAMEVQPDPAQRKAGRRRD